MNRTHLVLDVGVRAVVDEDAGNAGGLGEVQRSVAQWTSSSRDDTGNVVLSTRLDCMYHVVIQKN